MNGQRGISLVELLISIGLSLSTMILLLQVYAANAATISTHLGATRLHHELRTVVTLMQRDLRRAGYSGHAESAVGAVGNANPFSSIDVSTPGCAIVRYDRDHNGVLASSDNEQFGYALVDGVISASAPGTAFDCAGSGGVTLTNRDAIEVTRLQFDLTERALQSTASSSPNFRVGHIKITVEGRLRSNPAVKQTLVETVRVRNDWM